MFGGEELAGREWLVAANGRSRSGEAGSLMRCGAAALAIALLAQTAGGIGQYPDMTAFSCSPATLEAGGEIPCTAQAKSDYGYTVSYVYQWADGTNGTSTPYLPSGTAWTAGHRYAFPGNFTASAYAISPCGYYSACVSGTLSQVVSVLPASEPRGPLLLSRACNPASIVTGTSTACTARAGDPNGDAVTYSFDFADGTPAVERTAASGVTVSAAHAYTAAGTYVVTVSTRDGGGLAGESGTVTVQVVNDTTPPTVTMLDPAPGCIYALPYGYRVACTGVGPAAVAGYAYLRATAYDPVPGTGVSRVEFLLDGHVVCTSYFSYGSYACGWYPLPLDAGLHQMSVRAVDGAGNARETATLGILVTGYY